MKNSARSPSGEDEEERGIGGRQEGKKVRWVGLRGRKEVGTEPKLMCRQVTQTKGGRMGDQELQIDR